MRKRLSKLFHKFAAGSSSHALADDGAAVIALGGPAQDRIDYAAAEAEFLKQHIAVGLSQAGALLIKVMQIERPGAAHFWTAVKPEYAARFLRKFLIEQKQSHLWSTGAVDELIAFLKAGASPKPDDGLKFLA